MFIRSGSVPNGTNERNRASAHHVPLRVLCPVAERTVPAVYLASAVLRSFCRSCSGRPPSVPAALLIARLYPASLRRSMSNPGPNRPLRCREMPVTSTPPFAFSYLLVFARSACAAAGASSCPSRIAEEQCKASSSTTVKSSRMCGSPGCPMGPRQPVVQ